MVMTVSTDIGHDHGVVGAHTWSPVRLVTSDHVRPGYPGLLVIIMGPKVGHRILLSPSFFCLNSGLDLCILASTKDVYEG